VYTGLRLSASPQGGPPCQIMLGRKLRYPWRLDDAQERDLVLPDDSDLKAFAYNITMLMTQWTWVQNGRLGLVDNTCVVRCIQKFAAKLAPLREGPFNGATWWTP
jgi:hypothetical protein